ncbi:unnamed protein product [Arctogadus glacialis]
MKSEEGGGLYHSATRENLESFWATETHSTHRSESTPNKVPRTIQASSVDELCERARPAHENKRGKREQEDKERKNDGTERGGKDESRSGSKRHEPEMEKRVGEAGRGGKDEQKKIANTKNPDSRRERVNSKTKAQPKGDGQNDQEKARKPPHRTQVESKEQSKRQPGTRHNFFAVHPLYPEHDA